MLKLHIKEYVLFVFTSVNVFSNFDEIKYQQKQYLTRYRKIFSQEQFLKQLQIDRPIRLIDSLGTVLYILTFNSQVILIISFM